MTRPLNLLIVEDSPDDAALLVAELRRAGFEPKWKRVETETDFLAELHKLPDLILCDYSLPQFSGLRAAKLAQESGLAIPFILISGTVGEDVAVEAMKRGATDYLLKDRIARLGSAIERALEQKHLQAERRRTEQRLAAFSSLGQKLSAAKSAGEAAEIIVQTADQFFGWDSCTLDLYSAETNRIHHVLNYDTVDGRRMNFPPAYDNAEPTPRPRRIIEHGAELILREEPYTLTDAIAFGNKSRLSASLMLVPIHDGSKVIGVLSIQSYTPNAYTAHDLQLLQSVGDHCGGALNRIQAAEALRQSEERFRQLAENIDEVFWITDPAKQRMLYVSPGYETIWARTCASLYAAPQNWLEAVHPEDRDRIRRAALTRQPDGTYDEEYRIVRPDQSVRWIHDRAFPVRDSAGQVERLVGVARDITERKQAAERSVREQARFKLIFDTVPIGIALHTIHPDGRFTRTINGAHLRICGLTREQHDQPDIYRRITHPDDYAVQQRFNEQVKAGLLKQFSLEKRYLHPDGRVVWVNFSYQREMYSDGTVEELTTVVDITERKLAEKATVQTLGLLRATLESTADGILTIGSERQIICYNEIFVKMWRIPDKVLAANDDELAIQCVLDQLRTPEDFLEKVRYLYDHPMEESFDVLEFKDDRVIERLSRPMLVDGRPTGRVWSFRDISKSKQAEAALQLSDFSVNHASLPTFWITRDARIVRTNHAACALLGYTEAELLKLAITDLDPDFTAEVWPRHWQELRERKHMCFETRQLHKDGHIVLVEVDLNWFEFAGQEYNFAFIRDITTRRQLEDQFRQSQKMDAIGQLAGGIAHDFNNILAVIQMQAGMLREERNLPPTQFDFASEIEKAAQRAANLTRQLLLFSRRQTLQPRDLDLNELISHMTKMLQRILGEDIQMQFNHAPEPLYIRADAGMVDQVLMNLTVNSRDAMPQGGQLRIETSAVEFDESTAAQFPNARPGAFVCLSVSDTGCGIPPEALPRIFEPFFTTKDVGKGTGLGLATVFGILQQHQGWIDVNSAPGQGTMFRVYLPRLLHPADLKSAPPSLPAARGGSETILVVEDDPALRGVVHTTLSHLGYRVLEAATGRSALEVWRQHHEAIHLVLTDLVMPDGMNGKELAEKLWQQNPRLKVIYTSGYSADIAGRDFPLEQGVNFIAKPFQIHELAQTIRARLDS